MMTLSVGRRWLQGTLGQAKATSLDSHGGHMLTDRQRQSASMEEKSLFELSNITLDCSYFYSKQHTVTLSRIFVTVHT